MTHYDVIIIGTGHAARGITALGRRGRLQRRRARADRTAALAKR
jgi:hypothetical protein